MAGCPSSDRGGLYIRRFLGGVLLIGLLLGACKEPASVGIVSSPSIRLAADSSCAALAESLLNSYESLHPDTTLTLERGGRAFVLAEVRAGSADAALVLHPLEGADLFHTPVGREMIVIIVHPDVPVTGLYRRDVRALFSGQVVTWPVGEGEAPLPVQVVTRERGSSTRLAFDSFIMQAQPVVASARLTADEAGVLEIVRRTPGAIGYVTHGTLGEGVRALAYEGVDPALESARLRGYPLTTAVEFVSRDEPEGNLRTFLEWILDAEGQAVVRRHMLGVGD